MFSRNNLPFGSRSPAPGGYAPPGQGPPPYPQSDYGRPARPQPGRPTQQPPLPARNPGDNIWHLSPAKSPHDMFTFGNLLAISPQDFPLNRDGVDLFLLVNDYYVFSARPYNEVAPGTICLSEPQRLWAGVGLRDQVKVQIYHPFSQGAQAYLGSTDIEIKFAGRVRPKEPYDQDELGVAVIKNFQNQIFAPQQLILMDFKGVKLQLKVKTVQRVDLGSEKAGASGRIETDITARGILTQHSQINFTKDPQSEINLKASKRRPAANAIIQPDFKFEDMGIGGLDSEFSQIFRRAFASRIFPPGLVENLGIQHVKGMLLYGPPGTGKTLIARQIGKMLNAREPKVINGPEILSKFVGQSEENIRKVFADAESEYKAKGEESGLHIIIFDELDAVCKQRGSTSGGTGVGDSVVNQLLSKLDGVDQLNNILLIGMTNRKDMIDDALLRPGRLEVHVEISLPDENGRSQILNIHTQKMRQSDLMDSDVDLFELARQTKNFSGAEIAGLVKSASSFAFNRHVKLENGGHIGGDISNMKVNRADFQLALDEVKPAFGVSEEQLSSRITNGIIHYSTEIEKIITEGRSYVSKVKETRPIWSVLLHGPVGSGKTALAAHIAIESEFPFIKMICPEDMIGLSEIAKVHHIAKIFEDAYKSTNSVVVVDDIEELIDYAPVGPRFSNTIMQTLKVLFTRQPPKDRHILIIATTRHRAIMKQLDLFDSFNADRTVPDHMGHEEMRMLMEHSGAFDGDEIRRALDRLFETPESIVNVGVRIVLDGIPDEGSPDRVGAFVEFIERKVEAKLSSV
ncbi:P-loop containing nucleoside triphosphate hydrolase protein [Aspergillus ambiguus]|uniref:AAA family ATPase SEC18 n=1 Tax=Aspergillus ambiguus TaxID=176160 RepID=UPI003CCE48CA